MQTENDGASYSSETRPDLARVIPVVWVVGLAVVYLLRYGAWLLPFQLVELAGGTLETLKAGPYLGSFWLARLADFVCVIAMLATAFAAGTIATSRLLLEKSLLTGLIALGVGLWLMAVAVLAVGVVSVSKIPFVFAGLACWLLPGPRQFLRRRSASAGALDGWAKLMLACILMAAVLNLPGTMAPPFEYDELEYHLGAPAEYIRAGRIEFLPHNFYSNMPQLTEMLFLLGMTTASDIAAKMLHWVFGLLGAVAVYAIAARLWTRNVGLTAAALFYCTPFVQDLSQTARVDLATAFFGTLAFGALLVRWDEGENRAVWASALCAGAAVATKWLAVPVIVLPVVAALLVRRRFSAAFGYPLIVAVCVSPWLVKNWVFAGNPVYPLVSNVFASPHWSAEQALMFASKHYPSFGAEAAVELFTTFWRYSFSEPRAVPLLLMTAPLMLLVRKADPAARRAGWLFVAAYGGWFLFTFRPWRFLFPAFPLAAMVGAYALEAAGRGRWQQITLRATVAVVLAVSLAGLGLNTVIDVESPERVPPKLNFLNYALGRVSRDEFVARMGRGTFEPVVWMNQNLPASAKVLYVGEARTYYDRHAVLWSTAFDQPPFRWLAGRDWMPELRRLGVTHIYVNRSELVRLQRNYGYLENLDWHFFGRWLEQTRVVHQSETGIVCELTE